MRVIVLATSRRPTSKTASTSPAGVRPVGRPPGRRRPLRVRPARRRHRRADHRPRAAHRRCGAAVTPEAHETTTRGLLQGPGAGTACEWPGSRSASARARERARAHLRRHRGRDRRRAALRRRARGGAIAERAYARARRRRRRRPPRARRQGRPSSGADVRAAASPASSGGWRRRDGLEVRSDGPTGIRGPAERGRRRRSPGGRDPVDHRQPHRASATRSRSRTARSGRWTCARSRSATTTSASAYDPAFTNTASCRSAITYIDGDKGILEYRGYPIEQLAEHCTYLEAAYLLIHGELPTADQLDHWRARSRPHVRARERQELHAGLPPRRPPDGDAARLGRRPLDLLPRRQRHRRPGRPGRCRRSG